MFQISQRIQEKGEATMRLRSIRESLGLSIEKLAADLKVQPRTLTEIEDDSRDIEPEAILLLLQRLMTRGVGTAKKSAAPAA
jgi:transcriptional regulator with XRE-family HTH domain